MPAALEIDSAPRLQSSGILPIVRRLGSVRDLFARMDAYIPNLDRGKPWVPWAGEAQATMLSSRALDQLPSRALRSIEDWQFVKALRAQ